MHLKELLKLNTPNTLSPRQINKIKTKKNPKTTQKTQKKPLGLKTQVFSNPVIKNCREDHAHFDVVGCGSAPPLTPSQLLSGRVLHQSSCESCYQSGSVCACLVVSSVACLVASTPARPWLQFCLVAFTPFYRYSSSESSYLPGSVWTWLRLQLPFWWLLHLCRSDSSQLSDDFYTCLIGQIITCFVAGFTEKMSRKRM